jgi:hypothetical protein
VSDFEARWRRLAIVAGRHAVDDGRVEAGNSARIDARTAAAIAARSRTQHREFEASDLRGLVLAASLFCACLPVLAWSAKRLGLVEPITAAVHDLTQLARCAPATSFIPPPPALAEVDLASVTELAPEFTARPGLELLNFLGDWLERKPPTAEISR